MPFELFKKKIKLIIFDVDGVLTTGSIYYLNQETELKGFNIYDGLGIKLMQKAGITVGIISAKKSAPVIRRLEELHIEHFYLGYGDKLPAYKDIKAKLQLEDEEIAYMGDDLPDLPLLLKSGFAITVPHAPDVIKENVDLITKKKGGKGAVREACEFILKAQNKYQTLIDFYIQKT